MLKCQPLIEKLPKTKQSTYLLKMNLKKINSFDLGNFIGKRHFDEDGAQNYSVFQPITVFYVK